MFAGVVVNGLIVVDVKWRVVSGRCLLWSIAVCSLLVVVEEARSRSEEARFYVFSAYAGYAGL